jgi:hypothetical protein
MTMSAAITACKENKKHGHTSAGSSLSTPDTGGSTGGLADTTREDSAKHTQPADAGKAKTH